MIFILQISMQGKNQHQLLERNVSFFGLLIIGWIVVSKYVQFYER